MTEGDRYSLLSRAEIVDRICEEDPKKGIVVNPILRASQLQAASVDVRLGAEFLVLKNSKITHLDPSRDEWGMNREVQKYTDRYRIMDPSDYFVIHPDDFVLGCTLEYVRLPGDVAARLEGRSSWGRLGVMIHATAGFIDPGYRGHITFELKNVGKIPVPLYPGVRFGQLSFFQMHMEGSYEYRGKYQDSFGVVASRYFHDYEYELIRKGVNYESAFVQIANSIDVGRGLPLDLGRGRIPQGIAEAFAKFYSDNMGDGRA